MKVIKKITLLLALLVVTNSLVTANPKNGKGPSTIDEVVDTYIDAVTNGRINNLEDVIDQNAKFILLSGKFMRSFTKPEMLESVLENLNLNRKCAISISVTETYNDLTIVKVDMEYSNLDCCNYLMIARTKDGLKITQVYSVFK